MRIQNHSKTPSASRSHRRGWIAGIVAASLVVVSVVVWPSLRFGPPVVAPEWAAGVRQGRLSSEYCISCHAEAGKQWRGSTHQLANQKIGKLFNLASFSGETATTFAATYRFTQDQGPLPKIEERRHDGSVHEYRPSMVIGHSTLRPFLIETKPGTFQATDVAWDPVKHEWFSTFPPTEERNPGEWGHWTGQSMNWNSMCARCHMTVYNKGYNEVTGDYRSTWSEQGIGCVQCHGPMTGHEKGGKAMIGVPNISRDPALMMQTCAGCHARAEDLTPSAPPGAIFEDHFRMQLMTDPRLYHADGQILDEVFEWGSFRHTKMAAAGVTCLDCHHAHTGKIKLPIENNSLCMQCHVEGNQRKAPIINPVAHSFHKADSKGNRCVECHMAETTYMQRDPRRDHGFITPDPLLKKELGIPDACSRCHSDQTVEWNIEAWEKWYGSSPQTAQRRERTRAVARAYAGDVGVVPELVRLIGEEKTPGWRASLLGLADQLAPGSNAVVAVAARLRNETDPLVRAAAIRALSVHAPSLPLVREALNDPVHLVRLDAALELSADLAPESKARRELDDYFNVMIENPVSLLRRGQDRFRRGRRDEGIADLQRAISLDRLAAPLPESLAFMLNATGRSREAAEQFEIASSLAPQDPVPSYYAALAWAEVGDLKRTEAMFRESVRRNPAQSRVWYNLGLFLNQNKRSEEALSALATAEAAAPTDTDIAYATATILLQQGRKDEAEAAARRVLKVNPEHGSARMLLKQLGRN